MKTQVVVKFQEKEYVVTYYNLRFQGVLTITGKEICGLGKVLSNKQRNCLKGILICLAETQIHTVKEHQKLYRQLNTLTMSENKKKKELKIWEKKFKEIYNSYLDKTNYKELIEEFNSLK